MVAQRDVFYYGAQEERMAFSEERARPRALASVTEKVSTAGGTMYVTVSVDEYRCPIEVFIRIGKMGETEHAHLTGLGRALSYALRTGANPLGLIDSLAASHRSPCGTGANWYFRLRTAWRRCCAAWSKSITTTGSAICLEKSRLPFPM